MFGLCFLIFGPAIGWLLGIIIHAIISSKHHHDFGSYSSFNASMPSYTHENSSLESEIRNHHARVEQMLQEQELQRSKEEFSRMMHENEGALADKLDTRITNIFRNPWEGIL